MRWADAALTVTAPLLLSCGGTAPAATDGGRPHNLHGSDRQAQLIKAARGEGPLSWYATLAAPPAKDIVDAFERAYPFLRVNLYTTDTTTLDTRVSEAGLTGAQYDAQYKMWTEAADATFPH